MKTKHQQHQPTKAQKVFGKDFDDTPIINERPPHLRSSDPLEDKLLFRKYKNILRQQNRTIKHVLR